MAALFARLGLWGLVLLLAMVIIGETSPEGPLGQWIEPNILSIFAKAVGALLLIALIAFLFEKVRFRKAKCKTCGVKVPQGYIYCRKHLSSLVEREDLKIRTLTNVPTPDLTDYRD